MLSAQVITSLKLKERISAEIHLSILLFFFFIVSCLDFSHFVFCVCVDFSMFFFFFSCLDFFHCFFVFFFFFIFSRPTHPTQHSTQHSTQHPNTQPITKHNTTPELTPNTPPHNTEPPNHPTTQHPTHHATRMRGGATAGGEGQRTTTEAERGVNSAWEGRWGERPTGGCGV